MSDSTLSRAEILARKKLRAELVDVPEWGGSVYVRELTAAERDHWEGGLISLEGKTTSMTFDNARATLAAATIVDPDGKRLFTTDDVDELGQLSGAALDRVYGVATRLSGITETDVEELAKN